MMNIAEQLSKIPANTKTAPQMHFKTAEMIDRFREAFRGHSYMTAKKLAEVTGIAHSSVCATLNKLSDTGFVREHGKIEGGKTVKWKWVKGR